MRPSIAKRATRPAQLAAERMRRDIAHDIADRAFAAVWEPRT